MFNFVHGVRDDAEENCVSWKASRFQSSLVDSSFQQVESSARIISSLHFALSLVSNTSFQNGLLGSIFLSKPEPCEHNHHKVMVHSKFESESLRFSDNSLNFSQYSTADFFL